MHERRIIPSERSPQRSIESPGVAATVPRERAKSEAKAPSDEAIGRPAPCPPGEAVPTHKVSGLGLLVA
jgi:hypothetical protein